MTNGNFLIPLAILKSTQSKKCEIFAKFSIFICIYNPKKLGSIWTLITSIHTGLFQMESANLLMFHFLTSLLIANNILSILQVYIARKSTRRYYPTLLFDRNVLHGMIFSVKVLINRTVLDVTSHSESTGRTISHEHPFVSAESYLNFLWSHNRSIKRNGVSLVL